MLNTSTTHTLIVTFYLCYTVKEHLLNPLTWQNDKTFVFGKLQNYGIYRNWSVNTLIENKEAKYRGINTDVCLEEVLTDFDSNRCQVSFLCAEMMLSDRIDTGYLLTHRLIKYIDFSSAQIRFITLFVIFPISRLLYLKIARLRNCKIDNYILEKFIQSYCSLMLKEAKTNEHLGFPQHDIFLEQSTCCIITTIRTIIVIFLFAFF